MSILKYVQYEDKYHQCTLMVQSTKEMNPLTINLRNLYNQVISTYTEGNKIHTRHVISCAVTMY